MASRSLVHLHFEPRRVIVAFSKGLATYGALIVSAAAAWPMPGTLHMLSEPTICGVADATHEMFGALWALCHGVNV